jgi:ubiquinone/menaquinone biosynthesis C-methylase UbiE
MKGVKSETYNQDFYCADGNYIFETVDDYLKDDLTNPTPRMSRLIRLSDAQKGEKILDVGCGRGNLTINMAKKGAIVTGIDYSADGVRIFKMKHKTLPKTLQKRITVKRMNAQKMSFRANSFDKVTFFDVLEHLTDKEIDGTMKEIRRVLKPGGQLIMHTAPERRTKWLIKLYKKIKPTKAKNIVHIVHINEKTPGELRALLREYDFEGRVWWGFLSNIYATVTVKK